VVTVIVVRGRSYLLGYWLGDGWSSKRLQPTLDERYSLICGLCGNDDDWVQVEEALINEGWRHRRLQKKGLKTWSCYPGVNFRDWLLELGVELPTTSYTKKIPSLVFKWKWTEKKQVVAGLFDSDGSVGKNGKVAYDTVSKELAYGVQRLMRSLKFDTSLYKTGRGGFQVYLKRGSRDRFKRSIELQPKKQTRIGHCG